MYLDYAIAIETNMDKYASVTIEVYTRGRGYKGIYRFIFENQPNNKGISK